MNCTKNRVSGTFPDFKFQKKEDVRDELASKCQKSGWIPSQDSILYKAHSDVCQYEVHTLNRSDSRILKRTILPTSLLKTLVYSKNNLTDPSIPSLTVEAISSGSEQKKSSFATPTNFPALKPVSVQLPPTNESNPNRNISNGQRGTCYVCNNTSGNGIRMFSFPSDPKMLTLWASACDLDPNRVFPGDSICSLHFKPEDIKNPSSDRKLCISKRTAVPIPVNEIVVDHHHDYIQLSDSESEKDITNVSTIEDIPCNIAVNKATQTEDVTAQQPVTDGRKRRYVGEFKISDMDNPVSAKQFYEIAMQEITRNRYAVHLFQRRMKRCKAIHEEVRLLKQKLRPREKFKKDSDLDYEIITVTS